MKLENLKSTNHGRAGITYTISGLTSSQYNDIYLQACELYNSIEQNVSISLFKDEMYGYLLCNNKI